MPAPPELGNAAALIRRIEIQTKFEAEEQGNADSHIAVATEVAVDLQRVAIHTKKIFKTGVERGVIENAVDKIDGNEIGDNSFFEQTRGNQKNAFAKHSLRNNGG